MNPATPVTSQVFGADIKSARRLRKGARITSSQWKSSRRADSGQSAREHACPIVRAAFAAFSAARQSIFHSGALLWRADYKSCFYRGLGPQREITNHECRLALSRYYPSPVVT